MCSSTVCQWCRVLFLSMWYLMAFCWCCFGKACHSQEHTQSCKIWRQFFVQLYLTTFCEATTYHKQSEEMGGITGWVAGRSTYCWKPGHCRLARPGHSHFKPVSNGLSCRFLEVIHFLLWLRNDCSDSDTNFFYLHAVIFLCTSFKVTNKTFLLGWAEACLISMLFLELKNCCFS
jgi:hypothetical protein